MSPAKPVSLARTTRQLALSRRFWPLWVAVSVGACALRIQQWQTPSKPSGHVVFAVVRQESNFLPEWLEYHIWLGYSHFYLFNQDDDKEFLHSALKYYVAADIVTLTPWQVGNQATAYLEAMKLFSQKVLSFTFLDVDEFVTLPEGTMLPKALSDLGLFSVKKCVELPWLSYGDAGVSMETTQQNGVLRTLTRRSRSIETEHSGKAILRGGSYDGLRTLATWKITPAGWWHGCDSFVSKQNRVTASPKQAYLAHFQFRYGNESLAMRVNRGSTGDFIGQSVYANRTIEHYAHRNEVFDDSLLKRSERVRESMQKSCACVNALGQSMGSPANGTLARSRSATGMLVFIHVCPSGRWRDILLDMMIDVREAGLLDVALMKMGVVGDFKSVQDFAKKLKGFEFELLHLSDNPQHWELPSVNYIREYSRSCAAAGDEKYVLYMHTKGVHDHGDFAAKWQWRKIMQAAVVTHHQRCIQLLDAGYDAVGINAVNMFMEGHERTMKVNKEHAWHYSGNFWWASTAHIARLSQLSLDHKIDEFERCKAENFVLSAIPNMCAVVLWQNIYPHIYWTDDLPRRRFDEGDTLSKLVGCRKYNVQDNHSAYLETRKIDEFA